MFDLTNIFTNNVEIIIQITSETPTKLFKTGLNLTDNLSIIRKELKEKGIINDTLFFLKKIAESNNDDDDFSEISLENEENSLLNDVIEENNKTLYLKKNSNQDWKFLNELHRLEYGCTMTFDGIKKGYRKAFITKDCKMTEIGTEGCRKGKFEFNSNKDRMMMKNLFFISDTNVESFINLGISDENSRNNNNIEPEISHLYAEYGKVSLKFGDYLEPTTEFINAVEDASKSGDPAKFKKITEEFGQFIPTEVTLGGRAYFKENNSKCARLSEASNDSGGYCIYIIGGQQPNSLEEFDEKSWVKSLIDYKNWGCIEFRNPISIFQLLPDYLRRKIIYSLGKRIHYSKVENFNYSLKECGRPVVFELNIPSHISKIIRNKDADCNFFATVADAERSKNEFFHCQILYPPNGKPSITIHCIQKNFRKRLCKLKIGWMVIGYNTDLNFLNDFNVQLKIIETNFSSSNDQTMIFDTGLEYNSNNIPLCLGIPVLNKLDSSNESLIIGHHFFNNQTKKEIGLCTFSYCLKNKRYVNLPNFTFYTLIISNYSNPNAFGTIPFEHSLFKKPYINLYNQPDNLNTRYISLYSTKKSSVPIFIKQDVKKISIKYINCNCKTCSVCKKDKKLKRSENSIECAFFNPIY
ncbi:5856_t:CDS:1 [Funneliformis geosporum]|uniref:10072_t:CDS:1 n=1 Tax=Funneliformis geosporum TaxID=1117311 RepID=A0A9W4SFE1_9GLOM|nr:5856_t:CDS:1 [Funneliformis geosporum]CAI2167527.1 10072_t:CDS:1 [Funneliformis geosporum]